MNGGRGIFAAALWVALWAAAATLATGGEVAAPTYVGAKACKKCHFKAYKSWEQTKMAKSFETLKSGVSKDAKLKAKLDADKDYTRDPKCLKCHTVGFGKPGGYATPAAGDKAAAEAAALLEGVQCESCHGPGSEYQKLMKADEKYPLAKAKELGLILPDKESCIGCHNAESPMVGPGYEFDFEKRKKEGTHEHLPLKNPH